MAAFGLLSSAVSRDNDIEQKKRESLTVCSFYKRRLWNCPVKSNEQTCRSLTQNMITTQPKTLTRLWPQNYIFTRHLLFASFLTLPLKFSRFPFVKKERQVNAFHYVCRPTRIALTGLLHFGLRRKVNIFLRISRVYLEKSQLGSVLSIRLQSIGYLAFSTFIAVR